MKSEKEQFIDDKISKMTIEQKVGQCLVLGYVGTFMSPEILRRIRTYTPQGIRGGLYWRTRNAEHDPGCTPPEWAHRMMRQPKGTTKDFIPDIPNPDCTAGQYCNVINQMKQEALNNSLGLPLHFTYDHEGDQSIDFYKGGMHQTPNVMGMAKTGDPDLVYSVHKAIGDQYRQVGFSWSHSLVLDINTNPMNPEICIRSFGETPEEALPYQLAALKGWQDSNTICTGKHFPGRGESVSDAHSGLPYINLSREQMKPHLEPYKELIKAGLPAIMTAHTAYPQLEPEDIPATLSKRILTDLLKGELGFEGCITTDAMAMGGIVSRFEFVDACTMALNAGADLLLIRDEGQIVDELVTGLVRAAQDGKLPVERLEDAIRRTMNIKYDYGFYKSESPVGVMKVDEADKGIKDPIVISTVKEAADRVVTVLKDEENLLPLKPETKVLVVEQVHQLHALINTYECKPSIFWEKMLQHSDNVMNVECNTTYPQMDQDRVMRRVEEADVIVITNYYGRRFNGGNDFVKKVHATGKPVVVVTNSHYPFTVDDEYKAVVCTYGCDQNILARAAEIIYGK